MSFLKHIKTHLFYLLSRRNIILLSVINFLVLILLLITSQIFKGLSYVDEYRRDTLEQFRQSSFILIKICLLFIFLFVNMSYFSGNSSKYSQYFIKDKKSKNLFFLTKYISIVLFNTIEYLILYFSYEFVRLLLPNTIYPFQDFKLYFYVYLMGLYYLFLSSFLLIITESNFSLIIPLIMFWGTDILLSSSDKGTIFNKIILAINVSVSYEGELVFGVFHAILMIIIMIEANFIAIKKKDS